MAYLPAHGLTADKDAEAHLEGLLLPVQRHVLQILGQDYVDQEPHRGQSA